MSGHASRFVLKGGVLLAALEARRATRDVDLGAIDVSNEPGAARSLIADIASIDLGDGYEYVVSEAGAHTIREGGTSGPHPTINRPRWVFSIPLKHPN